MSPRTGPGEFVPLPQRVPRKGKEREINMIDDENIQFIERSPRRKKKSRGSRSDVMDDEEYPRVESHTHRRVDSGKHWVDGRFEDFSRRRGHSTTDSHYDALENLQRDRDDAKDEAEQYKDLYWNERLHRIDADKEANRTRVKLEAVKTELTYEKRERRLDQRERVVNERERRDRDDVIVSRPRREVVVVQHPSVVNQPPDPGMDALIRARKDYNRKSWK